MRYVVSDLHGEFELFVSMLDKIRFSKNDVLYVLGDVIDKGNESVRLLAYISECDNIKCIIGNHELAFLKQYHALLESSTGDDEKNLQKLKSYFQDGHLLSWELVDFVDSLPSYIEEDDFICVHAGIPLDSDKKLIPLADAEVEQLVHDRRFKSPELVHLSPKCVFFGHTQTDVIAGESKILGYPRDRTVPPKSIKDFYKIHMDTGTWSNGVLGCFCIDTLKAFYVKKKK